MKEGKITADKKKQIILSAGILVVIGVIVSLVYFYHSSIDKAASQSFKAIATNSNMIGIQEINEGDVIEQEFTMPEDEITGLGLKFSIANNTQKGKLVIELRDVTENNEVIEHWERDITELITDVYNRFELEKVFSGTKGKVYRIAFWLEGSEVPDSIRVYYDGNVRTEYSGLMCYFNNEINEFDLMFEVSSDTYPYHFIRTTYIICAIAVVVFFALLYFLLFVKKAKIENVFLVTFIFIGLLYTLVFNPFSAPDEPKHFATAYHLANKIMGSTDDESVFAYVRKSDAESGYLLCPSINMYKNTYDKIDDGVETEKIQFNNAPILYANNMEICLPSAIGVLVGKALNLNTVWLMELGRIFNMLFLVILIWLAIKITPIGKMVFFSVAMFPMVLEQATSYSYDVTIIGGFFLYIAYFMYLIYEKDKLQLKDYIIMAILTLIMSPCKLIYVAVAGLVLLLPIKKIGKKAYFSMLITVMVCLLVGNWYVNLYNVVTMSGTQNTSQEVTEETSGKELIVEDENGSEYTESAKDAENEIVVQESPYYTLQHFIEQPLEFIKIYANTLKVSLYLYIFTTGGSRLGWLEINVKESLIALFFLIALCSVWIVREKETKVKWLHRVFYIGIVISVIFLAMLAMLLGYTPKDMNVIQGVQGRYFLPVVPLAIFAFANIKIKLKEGSDKVFVVALAFLNIIVLMQVLTTTLFR